MRAFAFAFAFACALAPSIGRAQECEEGRERIDSRCCWPGQTFSAEHLRCEGEPRCPPELAEHGETCVARVSSTAPVPSAPTTVATLGLSAAADLGVPEAYGPSTRDWPTLGEDHPSRAARVRGKDLGLIEFALSIFDVGFLFGWLTAGLDEASRPCAGASCGSWPLAFIPVAGGLASGLAQFGSARFRNVAYGVIIGIPSVILQVVGLIAAIVAFSGSTDDLGFRPIGDPHGVSLSFVLGAPNADAGLSVDLRF